jgi:hypothetical protein
MTAGLTLCLLFFTSCGGDSELKKELEAQKKEFEKVEIETLELNRTPTERRIKVQTKGKIHPLNVTSQPDGVECEDLNWDGKKGQCRPSGHQSSGSRDEWILVVRRDVEMQFAFFASACGKGLVFGNCKSEFVHRTVALKGP